MSRHVQHDPVVRMPLGGEGPHPLPYVVRAHAEVEDRQVLISERGRQHLDHAGGPGRIGARAVRGERRRHQQALPLAGPGNIVDRYKAIMAYVPSAPGRNA